MSIENDIMVDIVKFTDNRGIPLTDTQINIILKIISHKLYMYKQNIQKVIKCTFTVL